jgi:hypothetical protein
MKTSIRIAKQLKKLTVSSKLHDLKEFVATRGTIEQRKAYFQVWANTLQEMLASHHRYQALMRDYPRLNNSELTITANAALGHFIRLKLKTSTLHTIESTIGKENRLNGFLILQYLFNTYGNATLVDARNAREKLESTIWNEHDTVDTFTHRFMHRLSLYNDSIISSRTQINKIYSDDDVTMLYLQLLVTSMPTGHNLYRVQTLYSKYELDIEAIDHLNIHISHIQRKLYRLELTRDAHVAEERTTTQHRPRRHSYKPPSSKQASRNYPGHHAN